MMERCHLRPLKDYGLKGIVVCKEWHDFLVYREWALANGYRDDLEIDRINSDGNYEPSNCRFVTHLENMRGREYTIKLTAFGETKTITEWAADKRCKIKRMSLYNRIKKGIDPEIAITLKAQKHNRFSK